MAISLRRPSWLPHQKATSILQDGRTGLGLHHVLAEALPTVTAPFLPVLRFNSQVPPLGELGVRRQREREEGNGEAERGRLGGGLGAAGPGGECLPFLNLCPHSRDLPPTRKGKLKASPSDHVSVAQGLGD